MIITIISTFMLSPPSGIRLIKAIKAGNVKGLRIRQLQQKQLHPLAFQAGGAAKTEIKDYVSLMLVHPFILCIPANNRFELIGRMEIGLNDV
jgi:hypothetical protein